jgi:calcium-dependent protein kinase
MHDFSSSKIKNSNHKILQSKANKIINKSQVYNNIKKNIKRIQQKIIHNKYIIIEFLSNQKCSYFSEKFELLNYINSGSSGVVFKGFEKKNPNYQLCFKFFMNNLRKVKKSKIKNQCLKEINIHNKLKNDNIINYYDYISMNNISCIIMEYAELGDLEHFHTIINTKRNFSESLLSFITIQILRGLLSLTKSKIIHMDIKPQNLLIDKNLNIKITDFSASFSYENYKKNNKILLPFSGTSLYMSPEVLLKSPIDYEDCSKIDMFSLGVVLYNLAFEKFPYELDYSYKRNFALILEKIQKQKLLIPEKKNFSALFKKFLGNLLEKNIKNRINIYDALEDPWIKGADILFKEKEKLNDLEKFLINMITDNVRSFNEYLKNNNNSETFHTSN